MKEKKTPSKTTSFTIMPDIAETLDLAHHATGTPKGDLINEALREHLDDVISGVLEGRDSYRVELEKSLTRLRGAKRTRKQ